MWILILRAVLIDLLIAVAAVGAGNWIYSRLSTKWSKFDRASLSWLGGFGLLSLSIFLVGQWRFSLPTVGTVIAIALILAVRPLVGLFQEFRHSCREYKFRSASMLIVFSVFSLIALGSLAEITGDWSIDAVVYHLLGPKIWVREGVIRPVPDNCHTAMPQTAETIYAAALMLGGQRGPGLSNVVTFGMLLLVAGSLAKRAGLESADISWAVALIVTMPAVVTASTHTFVDGLYAAFVLAAARTSFDGETTGDFVVAGIFGGLALGTKYTGLLAVPTVLFCSLLMKAFEGKLRWDYTRKALSALGVAGVVASPYYLRNWILLGTPIYPPPPLLWRFFDAKYLSPQVILNFHQYILHRGQGFGKGIGAFLLLPFNLTYHTSNFYGAGGIGICPLALSAFGIITSWRNAFARTSAILGTLLLLLWFVTQQESRFLVHGYVLSAVFAVLGWRYVRSLCSQSARHLAVAVVAVSVCYGAYMIGRERLADGQSVLSAAAAEVRERDGIPFRDAFRFINSDPSVVRVLIPAPSVPAYYSDKPYVKPVGTWGERTLSGAPDSKEALRRIHEWNVSHVMDVQSDVESFSVTPNTPGLVLVFESKDQRIYRVE